MHIRNMPRALLSAALLFVVSATAVFAFPSARIGSRMSYEPATGSVILYGGVTMPDSSGKRHEFDDTWQWTGRRWVQLFPANTPGGRGYHSMAYFRPLDGLVIFGGNRGGEPLDDTWIYRNGNWSQLTPATSPTPRFSAATAVDTDRNRIVIFGGFNKTAALFDTWEFDGVSWIRTNEAGPKITNATLGYDSSRDTMILLGLNDKFERETYRYTNNGWTKLSPAKQPTCITEATLILQEHNEKLVLVGGSCSGFGSDETWEWDGSTWVKIEAKPTAGAVYGQAATYDAARQEVLIFGGADFTPRSTTYSYRDARYVLVATPETDPGPRSLFVMQRDSVRNVVWLYGGHTESSDYFDLWKLQNGKWTNARTSDIPNVCGSPFGAFDSDRGRLVILCEDSNVFEWDGEKWHSFSNVSTKPPGARFRSMTYDANLKRTITFGGYNGALYEKETWTWDGTKWERIAKNNQPKARALAVMFYDPISKKTYLHGGIGQPSSEDRVTRYADFHVLDNGRWTEIKTGTIPPARYGSMVATNPETGRTLVFGGKNEKEEYTNEQWEWNGSAWVKLETGNTPPPRLNGGLAFDPSTGSMALYGGYAGLYFQELWLLRGTQWTVVRDTPGSRRRSAFPAPRRGAARPGDNQ